MDQPHVVLVARKVAQGQSQLGVLLRLAEHIDIAEQIASARGTQDRKDLDASVILQCAGRIDCGCKGLELVVGMRETLYDDLDRLSLRHGDRALRRK